MGGAMCKRQFGLSIDEQCVCTTEGFRPNGILLDPSEPIVGECRIARTHDRNQTNVAGFGNQDRANGEREILGTCIALTHMRKSRDKMGLGMHFQNHFRQVYSWQTLVNTPTQGEQTLGLFETISWREHWMILTFFLLHTNRRLGGKIGLGLLIGGVQLCLQGREYFRWFFPAPQCLADLSTYRFPGDPLQ